MHRRTTYRFSLIALLSLLLCSGASAAGKIAIDALHGQPHAYSFMLEPDLTALYPDYRFVPFSASRIPIYHVLAEGTFTGEFFDSVEVTVPEDEDALYVVLDVAGGPGVIQYPVPIIVGPGQINLEGGYGICHLDDPEPGRYVVYVGYNYAGLRYKIGTGPHIWQVYPPSDYDAIVDFHCRTLFLFTGEPVPRSAYDYACLQQFVDSGGGIGVYYDGTEPIALKPIIRLRDFAREGATVRLDLPGHVTYAVPTPQKTKPLTWEIAPTTAEVELDYEAEFHQPLNFISRGSRSSEYINRSWATVHDAKILRFVRGDGYRISEVGTLAPGEKGFARGGAILPFAAARGHLDQMLRKEAETAGLTANETESFFTTYQWAMRLLSESCDAAAEIVLYRIESGDYDALFPLTTDPQPAEIRRVLWVYSVLPDAVTETYPVHPPVAALSAEPASRITGVFHEYGFFRETYGGDALDEMDAWGWHFYDEHLEDPTDQGNDWGQYYFDTWGQSPLVTRLSLGVTRMFGQFTGGITPLAGPVEVVLSGDDDTHSNSIFPPGSYPPVVVARQEASGGRVVGYGDLAFLADSSDNVQFSENVFEWLCEGATGGGPDIDIAVAVIEMSLDRGQAITSNLNVWNIGDAPLLLTTTPPFTAWFGVLGPTEATINPGDSIAYELTWTTAGIEAGYHTLYWTFSSNDPNESELVWPVRLRVIGSSAVDPQDHTATVRGFRLVSAAPNPFNARTTVTFELPTAGEVLFDLYNLVGQRVERIAARPYAAGTHEISLDFSDKPAGLYFLRATMGADVRMQKLMLLK